MNNEERAAQSPSSPASRLQRRRIALATLAGLAALALVGSLAAWACGPFFPNWLLGDERRVTTGPTARFAYEVERLFPPGGSLHAVLPRATPATAAPSATPASPTNPTSPTNPATNAGPATAETAADPYARTVEIDRQDLATALSRAGLPAARQQSLLAAYDALRAALRRQDAPARAADSAAAPAAQAAPAAHESTSQGTKPANKPVAPAAALTPPPGLPAEFADYLEGAIAYHAGRWGDARRAWERLLARPEAERRNRSTWAAFMLGRTTLRAARPGAPAAPPPLPTPGSYAPEGTPPSAPLPPPLPDPVVDEAVRWFTMTRALAAKGFADHLGLAVSSLGWQARAEADRRRFDRALALYGEQQRAGDPTAASSLRFTGRAALAARGAALVEVAREPAARNTVTALVLSIEIEESYDSPPDPAASQTAGEPTAEARAWLAALQAAGLKDAADADRLAWAAYRAGDFKTAAAWLGRAKADTPVARWVRARLLLLDGKLAEAETLLVGLGKLAADQAIAPDSADSNATDAPGAGGATTAVASAEAAATTAAGTAAAAAAVADDATNWAPDPYLATPARALGEAGAVALSRGEFAVALDHFLRAGYWLDAAYVAERVLTLDELRGYVDRSWPPAPASRPAHGGAGDTGDAKAGKNAAGHPTAASTPEGSATANAATTDLPTLTVSYDDAQQAPPVAEIGPAIRFLLGRRMVREGRAAEARAYLPASLRGPLDDLIASRRTGADTARPAAERAKALFRAACLTRHQGLQLLGTEVEPDWQVFDGNLNLDLMESGLADRGKNPRLHPTGEEAARAEKQRTQPWKRFHYRYVGADLARAAADLLPAASPERAGMLATAGQWLAGRDPAAAQPFYQALVSCCGTTPLGRAAIRTRWLPKADTCDRTTEPTDSTESTDSGDSGKGDGGHAAGQTGDAGSAKAPRNPRHGT